MADELQRFPRTGRFLMGRLRDAMSLEERELIEKFVGPKQSLQPGETIARRGALCGASTMLVRGFAVRTIERGGEPHIVGVQVPGDFVDLHGFALKRLDHDLRPATFLEAIGGSFFCTPADGIANAGITRTQ